MKSSINFALLTVASIALTACTNTVDTRQFERMSPIELAEYNRPLAMEDQVYCVDEIRTGSLIRRRHCNTLLEIVTQMEKSVNEVTVLSTTRLHR